MLDFGFDALESRISIVALLQQHLAFDQVGIVDNVAGLFVAIRFADLAQANLGSLLDDGDIFHANVRTIDRHDDRVFDVLDISVQALCLNVDLLGTSLDKAAAAVGIVEGQLLLNLGDAQPVADQFVRIQTNLVFLGESAERGHIDNVGYAFELFAQCPVGDGLGLHHIVSGVLAFQGVPIDLAGRTPVRLELRHQAGRKCDHPDTLDHPLAIPVVVRLVVEGHHEAGDTR